jgi:uncharacterized repeat protein (TIGR03803 family)
MAPAPCPQLCNAVRPHCKILHIAQSTGVVLVFPRLPNQDLLSVFDRTSFPICLNVATRLAAMPRKEFSAASRRVISIFISLALLQLLIAASAFSQSLVSIHHFGAQSAGRIPLQGSLLADASGNLYGTTYYGGTANDGTVFALSPPTSGGTWTETVLYSFAGGTDGRSPFANLVADQSRQPLRLDDVWWHNR